MYYKLYYTVDIEGLNRSNCKKYWLHVQKATVANLTVMNETGDQLTKELAFSGTSTLHGLLYINFLRGGSI